MTESKDVKQGREARRRFKVFSASGCGQPSIFLPRIHIGHRSSIGVAVCGQYRLSRSSECRRSYVVWTQLEHARPGGICAILQNDHSHSDLLPVWMIAANYYGSAIPSPAPLAATSAALLLTNIALLVIPRHGRFAHLAGSLVRNHAIINTAIVLTAVLTWASGTMWPDVLAALGILYVNESAAEHIWLATRELPPIDA